VELNPQTGTSNLNESWFDAVTKYLNEAGISNRLTTTSIYDNAPAMVETAFGILLSPLVVAEAIGAKLLWQLYVFLEAKLTVEHKIALDVDDIVQFLVGQVGTAGATILANLLKLGTATVPGRVAGNKAAQFFFEQLKELVLGAAPGTPGISPPGTSGASPSAGAPGATPRETPADSSADPSPKLPGGNEAVPLKQREPVRVETPEDKASCDAVGGHDPDYLNGCEFVSPPPDPSGQGSFRALPSESRPAPALLPLPLPSVLPGPGSDNTEPGHQKRNTASLASAASQAEAGGSSGGTVTRDRVPTDSTATGVASAGGGSGAEVIPGRAGKPAVVDQDRVPEPSRTTPLALSDRKVPPAEASLLSEIWDEPGAEAHRVVSTAHTDALAAGDSGSWSPVSSATGSAPGDEPPVSLQDAAASLKPVGLMAPSAPAEKEVTGGSFPPVPSDPPNTALSLVSGSVPPLSSLPDDATRSATVEETAQATPKLPHEGLPVLWTIKGKDGTVTVFDTSSVEMPRLLTRAEKPRALQEQQQEQERAAAAARAEAGGPPTIDEIWAIARAAAAEQAARPREFSRDELATIPGRSSIGLTRFRTGRPPGGPALTAG